MAYFEDLDMEGILNRLAQMQATMMEEQAVLKMLIIRLDDLLQEKPQGGVND